MHTSYHKAHIVRMLSNNLYVVTLLQFLIQLELFSVPTVGVPCMILDTPES